MKIVKLILDDVVLSERVFEATLTALPFGPSEAKLVAGEWVGVAPYSIVVEDTDEE